MKNIGCSTCLGVVIASALALTPSMAGAEDAVCSASPDHAADGVSDGRRMLERDNRLAGVRARHESELMRYPGVVGVAQGVEVRQGKPGTAPCLVVYVKSDTAANDAAHASALPDTIEGIPVHIVDVGNIEVLPRRD